MSLTRSRLGTSVWFAVGLSLLFAVIAAVLIARPWSTRYRRFISQPLPDGSRYTFLYPAHLPDVLERVKPAGASPSVSRTVIVYSMVLHESQWDILLRHLGISTLSPRESVHVGVIPIKSGRVQDSRWSERWERGGERRHNAYFTDARTRTKYVMFHSCPTDAKTQFDRHDPVIVNSFRVLPPGTDPTAR